MPVVIGIDPGKSGAVVALDLDRLPVRSWITKDEFTVLTGKSKRSYVEGAMGKALSALHGSEGIVLAVLEKQQAMPKQGISSTFQTGLGFGLWRGVLGALEIPTVVIHSKTWQREICRDLPGDTKKRAILACFHQLPSLDLTPGRRTKPFDGIADAACMALYGLATVGL